MNTDALMPEWDGFHKSAKALNNNMNTDDTDDTDTTDMH